MFRTERATDGVTILTMDDGKVNAIGPAFLEGVERAWQDVAKTGDAVVLVGNAKAFSAGLDLKTLPGLDRDEMVAFFRRFVRVMATLYAHPRPVVTAVDGPALAGGAFLMQMGDARLVTPNARVGYTEMPVGIPFPPPILALATSEVPEHERGPAILGAAVRAGAECVERGWAHRLVAPADLRAEAVREAARLAAFPARAYAATKAGLRGPWARAAESFAGADAERYVDDLMHPETIEAIVRYFESVRARR